jgi:hypothetical protein
VGIYVGIGLSLLLLVKSAGNYSLRPLKLDRERATGFVVTDDENYDVYLTLRSLFSDVSFILLC